MTKIIPVVIPDHHKDNARSTLEEAIGEEPDSVIVMCFWKDRGQYKIKTSSIQDRLSLIGALEEAKNKVLMDGYAS